MTHSQNIKIVQVPINDLNPAVYNPRKWDKAATDALTESIKRFGLVDPILANSAPERKGTVIGGHFRLHVAKQLGYTEVPVVYLDIPDIEKEKELNLRLNKNTGDWDYDLLKDFDSSFLLDVGFSDVEIGEIWDTNLETQDDEFNVEHEIKKIKETSIKPGDMFVLGNHRLICGDARDRKVVQKIMGTDLASMIYADPPYNIGLDYNKGVGGKQTYGGNVDDNKTDAEYFRFLEQIFFNAIVYSHENVHVFAYCDQRYIGLVQAMFEEIGVKNQRVCLWIKNGLNVTPHVSFNKSYEPAVYGIIGKPYLSKVQNLTEVLNKEIGTGNQGIDDIYDLFDIWLSKRVAGNELEHPTTKPTTLHEKPLRRCTKVNDVVLDMFGGSGSTLIACEQMKRRAFLIEKEPIFCQLIINRYEKLTGQKVTKYVVT